MIKYVWTWLQVKVIARDLGIYAGLCLTDRWMDRQTDRQTFVSLTSIKGQSECQICRCLEKSSELIDMDIQSVFTNHSHIGFANQKLCYF